MNADNVEAADGVAGRVMKRTVQGRPSADTLVFEEPGSSSSEAWG